LRDIIYRGKDKHKKWQYGFYLKEKTLDGNVLSYIDKSDMLYNIDKVEVDPNTIQEYSGFTDKNKTRVFEGDILYKEGYWKYYVEFEDGAFRAIPLNLVQKYSWVHYNLKHYVGNDILDEDKFEIIGNIYDKEDERVELNQCNDCKEVKKLEDELELTETNYKILLDKALEIAKKADDRYKEIERVQEALEESFRRFNYHYPFDKTNYNINDALLELNTQLLEDNEKNTKYISRLQTDIEKMKNQRDRAIEKLMNNMSLSPDVLYEIIRG